MNKVKENVKDNGTNNVQDRYIMECFMHKVSDPNL